MQAQSEEKGGQKLTFQAPALELCSGSSLGYGMHVAGAAARAIQICHFQMNSVAPAGALDHISLNPGLRCASPGLLSPTLPGLVRW